MNINRERWFDLSMGVQSATTWLLKKPNELVDARNVRFGDEIGSAVGRPGMTKEGSAFSTTNTPTGGHVARFREGSVRFVAVNNDANTFTYVKYQNEDGTWSNLITDIPVDSQVFFLDYLNEVYVSGYSTITGEPFPPYNINSDLNVSQTRNLENCPPPYYFAEYLGLLYAANVLIGNDRFPDRVYKSSPPTGALTFTQGDQNVTSEILVDSARYLKTGMNIDIYSPESSTKLYDLTITAVDKANNKITVSSGAPGPATVTAANVNTTNETLTTSAAHGMTTGTPIIFTAGTTAPTGLVSGGVYYVINVTSTTLKLATSYANAIANTPIDITAAGSGTNTLTYAYILEDNCEVYLDGRHGELSLAWNTDYPTEDRADFLAILPGTDSSNEITAIGKSSNRLFIFTENSGTRWDGQNLITFNNTTGCISHRTLRNIDDDWLIWLDASGKIRARNESQGDQQDISRGIYNTILSHFTEEDLRAANAVVHNNHYKLYLGTLDGAYTRIMYDFDSNTMSPETLGREPLIQVTDYKDGVSKPFFFGANGFLYVDEYGDDDDGMPIHFMTQSGKTNFGTEGKKSFYGMFIYSTNAVGLKVMASVDGGPFKTVGQIQGPAQLIKFPSQGTAALGEGTTIDYKISGIYSGISPSIEGMVPYFINREDIPQNG